MTPERSLMVFSGRGNPELSRHVAQILGIELGQVNIKTFADGEIYLKYGESVRGADVFIIQPTCRPVNENLMELLIMIQAARLASAHRVTAVVPWMGYSRQDKKSCPREPITARLVADIMQAAGVDRVVTMDLHAGQLQGFFGVPVDHMTALSMIADYFKMKGLEDIVVVSPDAGGLKTAKRMADRLGCSVAVLTKLRPDHNVSRVMHVIGEVEGKTAVIVDDIIDTAGTLVNGVQALVDKGAKEVYAACSHPVLSDPAYERIAASALKEVVVTDTIPLREGVDRRKIVVLSTADILADTIRNVFADESVSELFQGENQLF
ncbi:MAG: ribose-phosphate pyrophosphokinase [Actinobacteria bacterium RBG_16_64_13]|nr:MAG: ribose-phosphate pyrophosphokinase [Actinobacteria bacterium RBG_16_64_13]